jgi:hypothetical protein
MRTREQQHKRERKIAVWTWEQQHKREKNNNMKRKGEQLEEENRAMWRGEESSAKKRAPMGRKDKKWGPNSSLGPILF